MAPNRSLGRPALALLPLLALIWLVAACGSSPEPHQFSGVVYETPEPSPDLTLTTQHGEQFSLSDARGSVVALFFGYTHCPDVCPTTMADLQAAVAQLPEEMRHDIQVVMVTVDPDRDTPDILRDYMDSFDDSFLALSGQPNEVRDVLYRWRIRAEREVQAGRGHAREEGGYSMAHPSFTLVLDRDGARVLKLHYGTEVETLAADLRAVLES